MDLSKVKIRLMSTSKADVEKVRKQLLKKNNQTILGHPIKGEGFSKYHDQKWFVYGDYSIGKVRRRRGE
jgi:prephenate dehydrogenase